MNTMARKLIFGGLASVLFFVMCGIPSMAEALSIPEEPVTAEVHSAPQEPVEAQEAPSPSVSEDELQMQGDESNTTNEGTGPELIGETEIIEEEPVPLAGGPAPSVTIRTSRDINDLRIGDELVLTAELNGFQDLECAIRWQAFEDGQWKDIKGQGSTRMTIRITEDNASWAYRVAVDAAPAV